jgi:hypothetical protein
MRISWLLLLNYWPRWSYFWQSIESSALGVRFLPKM